METTNSTFAVDGFRYWGEPTDENAVIEFTYTDDRAAFVVMPSDMLSRLDEELTNSLERQAQRRGTTQSGWTPREVRPPRVGGEPQNIAALRITRVQMFEAYDGQTIAIRFSHGEDRETVVSMPIELAVLLSEHTRNRIAFAS
jgi:hypothetical protein